MRLTSLYHVLALVELALAVPTFVVLRLVTAPYGRYRRKGWGVHLPAQLAWVLMESPSALLFAGVFLAGPQRARPAALALLALWELHYAYRAFGYPLSLRTRHPMPVSVLLLGFGFNLLNASANAIWVAHLGRLPASWLADPRFLAGAALFVSGFALNVTSDRALRRLRAPGETGYRIPRGGAFELVSCPNYLGEIVEWIGWALASWSLAGLAFAVYTTANLAPRALAHHDWYRQEFPDYPPNRRALIPFLR